MDTPLFCTCGSPTCRVRMEIGVGTGSLYLYNGEVCLTSFTFNDVTLRLTIEALVDELKRRLGVPSDST